MDYLQLLFSLFNASLFAGSCSGCSQHGLPRKLDLGILSGLLPGLVLLTCGILNIIFL